jgi:hypothetical protein
MPVYSSYPAASAVMFLDFDGHTVNGTSWNYNGPIVCGASGLNNTQITEVFNRVAEDYRPFNINVTTDSVKYLAAPVNRRMRVIVTVSSSWYGSAGGVAFIGSFIWGDDSPCFVFSALLNYNVKNVAEAASHEAGHTLGLYHQSSYNASCVKTADYNAGSGSGEIGWAPIMGVGYYKNFTLWNNGPNSFGCNNFQSDLDIITSVNNGFGYRTDDHGNSFDSTTQSMFSNNEFTASGVIEKNTDQDIFSFVLLASGRFTLDAIPYNVGTGNSGSDLDMQVTLYNSSQSVLNIYNPGTLLNSIIDTVLTAATYYLKVEGKGNLYAPAYASLGSYSLRGAVENSIVLPLHRLELSGIQNGDKHQLAWEIIADEKIEQLILEVSTDGRNFSILTETGKDSRAYTYQPATTGTVRYRLNALFENGQRYYSNVVTIRDNENQARPKLISTLIHSNSIYVSSPGNYSYSIIDFNGQNVHSGKLTNGINTIHAGNMTAGMYIIRFSDNNRQWTDKMIRP